MNWIQQQLLSARDLIFALSKAVIAFSTQTASELASFKHGTITETSIGTSLCWTEGNVHAET
jgi:hypothetical protein